jgi:GDP-L-fucose synthase
MKQDSKIVVFGVSGLVGNAIAKSLIKKGYTNVLGTYNTRKPSIPYPLPLTPSSTKLTSIKVDLTDQLQTEKFFEEHRPEYIFLAAAKVGGILANNTYKAEFIYDNMAISLHVIHAAYKFGAKKLLNLGSSCIYPKFAPQPMKEEHLLTGELEPTNEPYAMAKISAIKLCRYYNEQYATNFISVMPTNLYGPNDNFNLETAHVLPALIRKFHLAKLLSEGRIDEIKRDLKRFSVGFGMDKKDEEYSDEEVIKILKKLGVEKDAVTIWGTGEVYREFLYIDDLADACVFLMEKVDAEDMRKLSKDYFVNIGVGEDIKLKDLAYLIKDIVGFKGEIKHDLSKPDGTPRKLLDVSKINQLGWKAKTSLEEGIRKTYEWYLSV